MNEETKHKTVAPKSEPDNNTRPTFRTSPEARVLLLAASLALAYAVWLGAGLLSSPEQSQIHIGMTATGILFGRAAGMAFGYSMGLQNRTVIPISMVTETILVLTAYSLFVFSWRHLLEIRHFKNVFARIRRAAETRKATVQRYGVIGLFAFVWFPFWMTGPVVGCVIGFLLGLRTWLNLTVVLAGTYVAILGWALLLREFHDRIASYSAHAATTVMASIVVIIILRSLLRKSSDNRK